MNRVQVTSSERTDADEALGRRCERFVHRVLRRRNVDGWEVSVLLCDDSYIRDLNRRYRKMDRATDVLSFSQGGGSDTGSADLPAPAGSVRPVGDVVISLDSLRRNAKARGVEASEELKRLLIHGILHLEGLDHEEGVGRSGSAQAAGPGSGAAAGGAEPGAQAGAEPGAEAPMIELQEQLVMELRRGTLF